MTDGFLAHTQTSVTNVSSFMRTNQQATLTAIHATHHIVFVNSADIVEYSFSLLLRHRIKIIDNNRWSLKASKDGFLV